MKKSLSRILFLFSFLFCLISCETGLGVAVDLQAPVITITFPEIKSGSTTFVPRSFVMTGTCSDNVGVDKVIVRYSYTANGKEVDETIEAVITDNVWQTEITVDADVDLQLEATAYDKMQNTSDDSKASVMVCVDTESPVAYDIGVRKNQQQTTLKALEDLASLDEFESTNKDDLQNEEFSIFATLSDNNTVTSSTLSLYDSDGSVILADLPTDADSQTYKPVWTIKGSELFKVKDEYQSERHYFVPKITVKDAAGNEGTLSPTKYLCWNPESDRAKALFPSASDDNTINVGKNFDIPVSVFDDDGLDEVYYCLVTDTSYSNDPKTEFETHRSAFTAASLNKGVRDYNFKLKSGDRLGTYYLVVAVKDKKQIVGYESIWSYYAMPTVVSDVNAPIIIVDNPQENTTASLVNNKFTLSGYSLDDASVVSSDSEWKNSILIAWLPNGNSQITDALKLLEGLSKKADVSKGLALTDSTGIKIWNPNVVAATGEDSQFKGYFKDSFSQSFNVLEDFKVGNTLKNENKVFVIYVVDVTGSPTYKTFRLGAYDASPTIEVQYASSESGPYYDFDTTVATFPNDAGGTVYFKLTPKGSNGIGINPNSLVGKRSGTSITDIQNKGSYYTWSYAVSDERLELLFSVEDVLGNTGIQKNTMVFEPKAILQSITTEVQNVTLAGDAVLNVQANFNGTVRVSGKPYIKLTDINGVAGDQIAEYIKGDNSDTLTFSYIVPAGALTDKAHGVYVGTETMIPITIPSGAEISGDLDKGKTFESISKYEITLDAVAPKLDVPNCIPKMNEKISTTTITLTFDEPIFAESGTVTVQRTSGWAIPPVLDDETFKAIYASVNSNDKKTLIGTDTGEPELLPNAATPKGPYKKITHGIKFVDSKAVPDTSTKYVLAFDYDSEKLLDIFATTGKVAEIREVLERYGYHKTEFDISECEISGNTLSVDVPAGWFVDGRQFEVVMTEGCVRDDAGNVNAEIVRGTYTFWTDKVATPWIIVDRYTHGAGIAEPNSEGTLGDVLTNATAFTTAPTGLARVRILCETPNVAISYGTTSTTKTLDLQNPPAKISGGAGKTNNIGCADMSKSSVTEIPDTTAYNGIFTVGDSSLETSGKYYIKASATYSGNVSGQPAMSASDAAYEGAYKTLIYSHNPGGPTISQKQPLIMQGSDSDGEPVIAGFPVRDGSPDERYGRVMYKRTDKASDYVLVSYDIISWFRMQTYIEKWSKEGDRNCYYGWIIYNSEREFH